MYVLEEVGGGGSAIVAEEMDGRTYTFQPQERLQSLHITAGRELLFFFIIFHPCYRHYLPLFLSPKSWLSGFELSTQNTAQQGKVAGKEERGREKGQGRGRGCRGEGPEEGEGCCGRIRGKGPAVHKEREVAALRYPQLLQPLVLIVSSLAVQCSSVQ